MASCSTASGNNEFKKIVLRILCASTTIVFGYSFLIIFLTWPIEEYSIAKAAAFGDSFGILTAWFSGMAFCLAAYLLYLQKKEFSKLLSHSITMSRIERAQYQPTIVSIEGFLARSRGYYKNIAFDECPDPLGYIDITLLFSSNFIPINAELNSQSLGISTTFSEMNKVTIKIALDELKDGLHDLKLNYRDASNLNSTILMTVECKNNIQISESRKHTISGALEEIIMH